MSIPDNYHRRLQKLIEQAQPQSLEELQALLDTLAGTSLDDLPVVDETPEDKALNLIDQAWRSSTAKGKKLAAKALELWPECLPAYELLAINAKSDAERLRHLEKAIAVGRKLYGGEFLEKHRGHFWGITETRPYMRCLNALAHLKVDAGKWTEAIVIWEDMLSLNPSDNQGVRYLLLPALLREGDTKSYFRYRELYEDDSAAVLMFNNALASFIELGDSPEARNQLAMGQKGNPYLKRVLLAEAPPSDMPHSYSFNSLEEAVYHAYYGWHVWREVPGALDWLRAQESPPEPKKAAPPFYELTDNQVRLLGFDPYSPFSPLQLNEALRDDDLPRLTLLQLAQALLKLVQENQPLPLTAKGNLQRKTIQQLYDLRLAPDESIDDGTVKLLGETDFFPLHLARSLCDLAKLLIKRKGKLSITKKGQQLLQSPARLYLEMLKTYTQVYNWAYPERWGYGVNETGREGWALIFYEIMRRGDAETSNKYYEDIYVKLMPHLVSAYPSTEFRDAEGSMKADFYRRFFRWFGELFGLIETVRDIKGKYDLTEEAFVRRTAFAAKVFRLG